MSSSKHTYVVIVNYLNWNDTLECTRSLLASSKADLSIIIVDNASGNQSLEHLQKALGSLCYEKVIPGSDADLFFRDNQPSAVVLVSNNVNAGFAAANNLVISALLSKDAWIWLLNPDMIVLPDTLENLARFSLHQKELSITGSVIRSWQQKEQTLIYGGGMVNWGTGTVNICTEPSTADNLDYISGASLFCHADCFRKAGLLPEEYFLVWEETDWCQRARLANISLAVCNDAVCFDKVSTVLGRGYLAQYYYTRNGLFFIRRYKKENLRRVLFAAFLRCLLRLVTGQWAQARGVWRGVWDFRKNKLHALE